MELHGVDAFFETILVDLSVWKVQHELLGGFFVFDELFHQISG